MAKFLMINCNRLVSGVQYPGISNIAAFLKKKGHSFEFFDTAEYSFLKETNKESAEDFIKNQFRPVKNNNRQPKKKTLNNLLPDLTKKIIAYNADFIGFSVYSDDWPFALFLIKKISTLFPEKKIIVGGIHPTVNPEQVISHNEIFAVCIGEGEIPLLKLLDSFDSGRINYSIANFWFRTAKKILKNKILPSTEPLYEDNMPDWSFYKDFHFIYPFEGKLYRRGSVYLSKGCPFSCSYCINSFYRANPEKFSRIRFIKEVEKALEEIFFLKKTYKLEFLRFWDESFLSLPLKYFKDFSEGYISEIGLPFTVEVTANTLNREKAKLLKEMGCQSVSIGVETSNEAIRKELLNKKISNRIFIEALKILSDIGLRKVVNFMFFLPNETITDMHNDIIFCIENRIEAPSPRIFYPYQGTSLRNYCIENKIINLKKLRAFEKEDKISKLEELNPQWATYQETFLDFSDKERELGKILLDNFILLMETPAWMHDWLIEFLRQNGKSKLTDNLRIALSNKRFA